MSHLPVKKKDVSILTKMHINLHEIDLRSDLFLVSFISFQFTCCLLKASIEIEKTPASMAQVNFRSWASIIQLSMVYFLCARARVVCESVCMSERENERMKGFGFGIKF